MARFARTYGSINHPGYPENSWRYPTAPPLDTFGVPIPERNITFGLEEFNFNPFYLKHKIGYVPCYGTRRFFPRPKVDELKLLYRLEDNAYCHYATLYNVKPLLDNDIPQLRILIEHEIEQIYFRDESQNLFGNDYNNFRDQIIRMFNQPVIAANENNISFLVNVKYESILILEKSNRCHLDSHYAAQWKRNVKCD